MPSDFSIERVDSQRAMALMPELVGLLRDAVNHGASVGFLPPIADEEAVSFWHTAIKEISSGQRVVLVAKEGDSVVGSVQLVPARQPNGRHRAEVQKLFVHTAHRGKGYGHKLMEAVEAEALLLGRTLLVFDTRRGDAADRLYRRMGCQEAGIIPGFAQGADGTLEDTVIFYRALG